MAKLESKQDVDIAKEILKRKFLELLSGATAGGLTLLEINEVLQDVSGFVAGGLTELLSEYYVKKD